MSEDNRKIIDVLEILLFDSHPIAHKVLPYLVFNKAHLTKSQLSEIQIRSILKKLVFKNYLKEHSLKGFENDSTGEQQKIAEDYFQQVIDTGATPESIVEAGIEKMKTAGIRVSNTDFINDDSIFKHPDMNKELKGFFEEDMFKAKRLSVHHVLGDLFKLTEDLKNGRDWKDI